MGHHRALVMFYAENLSYEEDEICTIALAFDFLQCVSYQSLRCLLMRGKKT